MGLTVTNCYTSAVHTVW